MSWITTAMQLGGWAMWGIVAVGLGTVGVAARFAWRGERALLGSIRWLLVALIATGCFGFVIDLQAVMQYSTTGMDAQPNAASASVERRAYIVREGLNESLYCLSSALLFTVVTGLLVAGGHSRSLQSAHPAGREVLRSEPRAV